jgi:peptidoglycan/LPS O-acetylase OafA/YrhL
MAGEPKRRALPFVLGGGSVVADLPMTDDRARLPHHAGLDGIRGLAVVAVLAYHGGFGWARGGYIGVSVFFTLSGFLITTLLLAEHRRDGRVGLRAFWGRRFRRLLPAAVVALVGVCLFSLTVATPGQRRGIHADVLAALAYVANWRFVFKDVSYGDLFDEPSPVLHFWSLAIEEQFYVFFPLLVVAVLAVGRGRRSVLAGGLALLAGSVPVVIMKELVNNHVGFLECLKVMLPDTVFLDGPVECFDIRILIRSILSSNFLSYSIYLQGTDKSSRRVL